MGVNIFYSDNSNVSSCYLWGEGMSQSHKRQLERKVNTQRNHIKSLNNAIEKRDNKISQLENELELALLDRCDCDLTEITQE